MVNLVALESTKLVREANLGKSVAWQAGKLGTGLSVFFVLCLVGGPVISADITGYLDQQERLKAQEKASKGLQQVLMRADAGEAQAQYEMGLIYRHGWGEVERNDLKAAMWLREAADKGHANAQHELGLMYEFGQGLPQSFGRALELYEMAAAQNLREAHRSLLLLMAKTQAPDTKENKIDNDLYEH